MKEHHFSFSLSTTIVGVKIEPPTSRKEDIPVANELNCFSHHSPFVGYENLPFYCKYNLG